jgi:hypothetical protein
MEVSKEKLYSDMRKAKRKRNRKFNCSMVTCKMNYSHSNEMNDFNPYKIVPGSFEGSFK